MIVFILILLFSQRFFVHSAVVLFFICSFICIVYTFFFFTSNLWLFAFRFYALVFSTFQRDLSSSLAGWRDGRLWETISMGRAKGIYMPLWPFKGSPRLTFVCCFVFCDFPHALCSARHIANLHAKTMKFIGPWLPGLAAAPCLIEMSFVLAGLSKYL